MVIWFIWSNPAVFFTASLLFITKTPVSAPPASAEQHLFPQCCFPECHFPPCFLWRSVSWVEPSAVSRLQASQKTVCMSLCWTCKKKKMNTVRWWKCSHCCWHFQISLCLSLFLPVCLPVFSFYISLVFVFFFISICLSSSSCLFMCPPFLPSVFYLSYNRPTTTSTNSKCSL